jgi:hypothetical protein
MNRRLIVAALCALLLTDSALADGPPPAAPVAAAAPARAPDTSAVYPGTQLFTAPHRPSMGTTQPNDVTLNFPNADVHEVAKAILGDILG